MPGVLLVAYSNPEDYWVGAQSNPATFVREARRADIPTRLTADDRTAFLETLKNVLTQEATDENLNQILYAAWILWQSGDPSGITAFEEYANGMLRYRSHSLSYSHRYHDWRPAAMRLAGLSGKTEAIPILITAFRDGGDTHLHDGALEGMQNALASRENWVEAWRQATHSTTRTWIMRGISDLSALGGPDAIDALLPLMGRFNGDWLQAVMTALRALSPTDEQWAQGWIFALTSENENVRREAVSELTQSAVPLAEQGLRQAVGDVSDTISAELAETELRCRHPESHDEWVTTWIAVLQGPEKQSKKEDIASRSRAIARLQALEKMPGQYLLFAPFLRKLTHR